MKHYVSPELWEAYRALPVEVQRLADKSFSLVKTEPRHPSVRLKGLGVFGRHASEFGIVHWQLKQKTASFGFGLVLMPSMTG